METLGQNLLCVRHSPLPYPVFNYHSPRQPVLPNSERGKGFRLSAARLSKPWITLFDNRRVATAGQPRLKTLSVGTPAAYISLPGGPS